ncbi:MAG: metallophosphoesterase [Candidatus Omnitrophota bacterium]
MSRFGKLFFGALAWMGMFVPAAGAELLAGPYLQRPATDGITIAWETKEPCVGTVHYGIGDLILSSTEINPATSHHLRLENLNPSTFYSYRCGWLDQITDLYTFKTAPPSEAESFRLVLTGDSRSNPQVCAEIAEQIRQASPDLVIHTGDIVSDGLIYENWKTQFFDPMKNLLNAFPFLPVLGNHEKNTGFYYDYFDLPGNENNWTLDFGNLRLIGLDSDLDGEAAAAMLQWLELELQKGGKKWTAVVFHHPLFSASPTRPVSDLRWTLQPLLQKYNVDLAVTGHDHFYLRTYPVGLIGNLPQKGVRHITTGGGGAPLYSNGETSYSAFRSHSHHFVILDFDGDKIEGRAIDEKGKSLDAFVIDENVGSSAEEYVSFEMIELEKNMKEWAKNFASSAWQPELVEIHGKADIPLSFQVPIQGSLSWRGGKQWTIAPDKLTLSLTPGQPLSFEFTALAKADNVYPIPALHVDMEYDDLAGKNVLPIGFRNSSIDMSPIKIYKRMKAAVPRASTDIVIDGVFGEDDWKRTAQIDAFFDDEDAAAPARSTRAALLHDDRNIYIQMEMEQAPHTFGKSIYAGRDNPKLLLNENVRAQILNGENLFTFLVSQNGDAGESLGADWNWNAEWHCAIQKIERGWTAEIAIPKAVLGDPAAGWRIDLLRRDVNAGKDCALIPSFGAPANNPIHAAELLLQ